MAETTKAAAAKDDPKPTAEEKAAAAEAERAEKQRQLAQRLQFGVPVDDPE